MECCKLGWPYLVPTPPNADGLARSSALHLPATLNNHRWRRQLTLQRRLSLVRACGSDGKNDRSSGKVFSEEKIGAEYGEGFETFRMDGLLKMDVDFLNDKLQECFLQRIRHAMKPDEAFGLIFSWDNVVAHTRSLKMDAWEKLAAEEGKDIPSESHVQRVMLHEAAYHVLQKVLFWGSDENELKRLNSRLSQLYHDNLINLSKPMEGLREWLSALYTAGIPCAVVSCLDRKHMLQSLERMELKKYFQAVITEEDGMESIAHRFLSAAVKLDRKPSKCIVFEDDPRGVTAAHNCTMMAIALIGTHPAYDLVQADLAVASFNDLSVINLRRLFAHKGHRFMDLQKQGIKDSRPRRKLTISSDSQSDTKNVRTVGLKPRNPTRTTGNSKLLVRTAKKQLNFEPHKSHVKPNTSAQTHSMAAMMGLTSLRLSSIDNACFPAPTTAIRRQVQVPIGVVRPVRATVNSGEDEVEEVEIEVEARKKSEQSLLEALDFSEVRSSDDAKLLDDARETTSSGKQMSREQYGALRRKIGGTYQDFFKSYVEVEGDYVEEGWVDKTCKVCKKDTRGEERQRDRFGKYVHVACLEKSKSNNFFSRFFS